MSSFEQKLKRIREIVGDLETGNLDLDESIKKFEEGIKLVKECHNSLEETRKKIVLLVEQSQGLVVEETFGTDDFNGDG